MMDAGTRPIATHAVAVTVLALTVGLVVGWWVWPSLSGADDQVDVMVIDDGFLRTSRRSVELRVREEGQRIEWLDLASTTCAPDEFGEAVALVDPERVVISLGDPTCEATAVANLVHSTPIVLVRPGEPVDRPDATDVIDPTHLVGHPESSLRLGCLWWEICPPERSVEVRDAQGNLTIEGGERVARLIAANV